MEIQAVSAIDLIGNVNSLPNKRKELETLEMNQRLYHECSILCFVQTWLNNNLPDACLDIPGFSLVWVDRDVKASRKNSLGTGFICEQQKLQPWSYYSEGEDLQSGH